VGRSDERKQGTGADCNWNYIPELAVHVAGDVLYEGVNLHANSGSAASSRGGDAMRAGFTDKLIKFGMWLSAIYGMLFGVATFFVLVIGALSVVLWLLMILFS
jgi:hypothetical protein